MCVELFLSVEPLLLVGGDEELNFEFTVRDEPEDVVSLDFVREAAEFDLLHDVCPCFIFVCFLSAWEVVKE